MQSHLDSNLHRSGALFASNDSQLWTALMNDNDMHIVQYLDGDVNNDPFATLDPFLSDRTPDIGASSDDDHLAHGFDKLLMNPLHGDFKNDTMNPIHLLKKNGKATGDEYAADVTDADATDSTASRNADEESNLPAVPKKARAPTKAPAKSKRAHVTVKYAPKRKAAAASRKKSRECLRPSALAADIESQTESADEMDCDSDRARPQLRAHSSHTEPLALFNEKIKQDDALRILEMPTANVAHECMLLLGANLTTYKFTVQLQTLPSYITCFSKVRARVVLIRPFKATTSKKAKAALPKSHGGAVTDIEAESAYLRNAHARSLDQSGVVTFKNLNLAKSNRGALWQLRFIFEHETGVADEPEVLHILDLPVRIFSKKAKIEQIIELSSRMSLDEAMKISTANPVYQNGSAPRSLKRNRREDDEVAADVRKEYIVECVRVSSTFRFPTKLPDAILRNGKVQWTTATEKCVRELFKHCMSTTPVTRMLSDMEMEFVRDAINGQKQADAYKWLRDTFQALHKLVALWNRTDPCVIQLVDDAHVEVNLKERPVGTFILHMSAEEGGELIASVKTFDTIKHFYLMERDFLINGESFVNDHDVMKRISENADMQILLDLTEGVVCDKKELSPRKHYKEMQ